MGFPILSRMMDAVDSEEDYFVKCIKAMFVFFFVIGMLITFLWIPLTLWWAWKKYRWKLLLVIMIAIILLIIMAFINNKKNNYYTIANEECKNVQPISEYERCLERVYNRLYGYPENYSQEQELNKEIANIEKQLN